MIAVRMKLFVTFYFADQFLYKGGEFSQGEGEGEASLTINTDCSDMRYLEWQYKLTRRLRRK